MLSDAEVVVCAELLADAESSGVPIAPLTERHSGLSIGDAYRIQLHNVAARQARGERVVGMKAGLTSEAMQKVLGVDQPDFGHLFDSMSVPDGGVVDLATCLQPRIEAEVGVLLRDDLIGEQITVDDVHAATEALVASLEIVDSRIAHWRLEIGDTVADNASSGRFVVGASPVPPEQIEPRLIEVTLRRHGEIVGTGTGAAVLGDPMCSVAWLARTLTSLGGGLRAGQVILSGAVHAMVPVAAGDSFSADFGPLGPVSVSFEGTPPLPSSPGAA